MLAAQPIAAAVPDFAPGTTFLLASTSSVVPPPAALPDWAKVKRVVPRKALIIGVDTYDHATQLSTPIHDVDIVSSALTNLGFSVPAQFVLKGRLDREALLVAIKNFAATLNEGDVTFVYFSGHGLDRDGFNYLVPSDAPANADNPARAYVPLSYLLEQLDKAHVAAAVILLDACRVNPFNGTSLESRDVLDLTPAHPTPNPSAAAIAPPAAAAAPDLHGGLASVDTGPAAVLLEYAAQPDHASFSLFRGDLPTAGSIFTRLVAARLQQNKDLPIKDILSLAEVDVFNATGAQQKPFQNPFGLLYLMLSPNAFFSQWEEESWARSVAQAPPAQAIQALRDFLRMFPNSDYAFAARQRIAELTSLPSAAALAFATPRSFSVPALHVLGDLQTIGQQSDGTAVAAANGDVALRGDWGRRFTEDRLGTIKSGELVRVLGVQPGSSAVKVVTHDGMVGYVGHLDVISDNVVTTRATLTFASADPFAEAVDWQPLTNLRQNLSADTIAVTIKTARDSDARAPAEAAQLRALRLRDAVIAQGVSQDKISLEAGDPQLPAHTAEILLSKVTSR